MKGTAEKPAVPFRFFPGNLIRRQAAAIIHNVVVVRGGVALKVFSPIIVPLFRVSTKVTLLDSRLNACDIMRKYFPTIFGEGR